ncbi:MAG: hypothetical protein K9L75_05570 [Spirochaetia bacterium]|nr:hypothetical protein [Spirochaetia bacterium]
MIFIKNEQELSSLINYWEPSEQELETLIISTQDDEHVLNEQIFGEPLFFVGNQKVNSDNKRLDIIAIDKNAQGVIIELKKEKGKIGVDTQALIYLSNAAQYTGLDFIKKFKLKDYEDILENFFYDGIHVEDLNKRSRIILMARFFDQSLYSMGQWLSSQGVSFKCISYEPIHIQGKEFINFSVTNDQSSDADNYKLDIHNRPNRETFYFWHNLGSSDSSWLEYLHRKEKISASFSNQEGDRGEEVLRNYIADDHVFAYVSGIGCIGYGKIKKSDKYKLIEQGSAEDVFPEPSHHRHRLGINWIVFLPKSKAIDANHPKHDFGIAHPIQTSSRIKSGDVNGLINELKRRSN